MFKSKKYIKTSEFVMQDAIEFLQERNVGEEYIDVLRGKLNKEISKMLYEQKEKRDKRTPLQYGQDLMYSKAKEIFMQEYFKLVWNRTYNFNGGEGDKPFSLKNDEITSDPDWISEGGVLIEYAYSQTEYWKNTGKADFRQNKLPHLLELSEINDCRILMVDMSIDSYKFIRITPDTKITFEPYIPAYGKYGYSMKVDTSTFTKIDRELYLKLKKATNYKININSENN